MLFRTFTQVIFLFMSNSCLPACILDDFEFSSTDGEERLSEETRTYKTITCQKFDEELRGMGAYSSTPMLDFSDDAFNDNDTLNPSNIPQALSQMGYGSTLPVQIVPPGAEAYQIFSTTSRFFKVIKSAEEGALLRTIGLSPISPKTKSMINLPEATFTYLRNGQIFHVLVLPSAPGKSLSTWINELDNPGKLSCLLIDSFLEEVGSAVAALHLERMNLNPIHSDIRKLHTCVHGDLHTHNIFFDSKTLQVTFIDTAGIGASWLAPQSPELYFLLIM